MRHRYSKIVQNNKPVKSSNSPARLSKKQEIYSLAETSQILNISQRTLYRYIDNGIIENLNTNPSGTRRTISFTRKSITSFIRKHSRKSTVEDQQKRTYIEQTGKSHKEQEIRDKYHEQIIENKSAYCNICHKETELEACPTCQKTFGGEIKRVHVQVLRAKLAEVEATLTIAEWLQILDYFHWRCVYCNEPFELMEHYIPISRGGGTTAENCLPACIACNVKKKNIHPEIDV